MSWLKVPKKADASIDESSDASAPSFQVKQGTDAPETTNVGEDSDEDACSILDDEEGAEDVELGATAQTDAPAALGGNEKQIKFQQKVSVSEHITEHLLPGMNISQYFLMEHKRTMKDWYETTVNMLINTQEYAVDAVKVEWLLKRKPVKSKSARKSGKKGQGSLRNDDEILNVSQSKEGDNGGSDSGDEDIRNTVSDISDEIMDGKQKIHKTPTSKKKKLPVKCKAMSDYRRLYNLMKY